MSTLMKAPMLFAGIAVQIVGLGLLLLPVVYGAGSVVGHRVVRLGHRDHAH